MWLSTRLFDLFKISQDAVLDLRTENASLKTERDALLRTAAEAKANFDWIRIRVNALELERATLIEKIYNVRIAAPEVARTAAVAPDFTSDIFNDMGDDQAKTLGLPTWGKN